MNICLMRTSSGANFFKLDTRTLQYGELCFNKMIINFPDTQALGYQPSIIQTRQKSSHEIYHEHLSASLLVM